MTEKPIPKAAPAVYATMLPLLLPIARRYGYVIAVHGSMLRDFDLVAVPWTSQAKPAGRLALAIRKALGGMYLTHDNNGSRSEKPHGRRCWSIHFGGPQGCYIDLSVVPRRNETEDRMHALAVAWGGREDRKDASRELMHALYGGEDALPRECLR